MKTRLIIWCGVLIGLLLLQSQPATPQLRTEPLCGDVKLIDSRFGQRVSILRGYPDFQQATLSSNDDGYILNITYRIDGIFQFERRPISEQELANLCMEIDAFRKGESTRSPDDDMNQEARRRFITSATTFSLGFYGWAVPTAFDEADSKAYAASYLLIGGTGFFAPMIATKNRVITSGMARAYTVGALNGIFHGLSLSFLVGADNLDENLILLGGVGVSIAESMAGLYLADKYNYSWGRMSIVGSGALWGTAYGYALPYILFDSDNGHLYGASSLLLSGAGLLAANHLYNSQSITHGDATYINSMGTLGISYALAIVGSLDKDDGREFLGGALLGSAAGLALGTYRATTFDYSRQQGNLIALGQVAGGLIGAGLSVLFEAEVKGTLWLTALGGTTGLFITEQLVKDFGEKSLSSSSNLRIGLNPYGLLSSINHPKFISTKSPHYNPGLVNLSVLF